jgi:hypothetical protein
MKLTIRGYLTPDGRNPFRDWLAKQAQHFWIQYREVTQHGKTQQGLE